MARFKKVKNEKEPVLPSQAWSTPVKQKSGSGDEDAAQSYLSGRVERVSSTGDALFDGINAGWGATVGAVGGALSAATGPVLSIGGEEEEKADELHSARQRINSPRRRGWGVERYA